MNFKYINIFLLFICIYRDGHVGLFLYGDLHHGHTQPCATFNNKMLTMENRFECIGLEIWGFHF